MHRSKKVKPAKQKETVSLRLQAKKNLQALHQAKISTPRMELETKRLIHELEVHKIELEMQNDELRQSRAEVEMLLRNYADLYDQAPVGYFTISRGGAILQANLTGLRLLGIDSKRLQRRRFDQFIATENRVAFNELVDSVLNGKKKYTDEFLMRREHGDEFWVQMEAISEDGYELRAVVMDITKQRIAEKKLHESEERFTAFMNYTPVIAWMKDESLRYVFINKAFERQHGKTFPAAFGKDDFTLWDAITAERFQANDRMVLASADKIETEECAPDQFGNQHFSIVVKFPIHSATGKKFIGGIAIDITERKRIEEELRASEERFRLLFENSGEAILLLEKNGLIYSANPEACRIFQRTERELKKLNRDGFIDVRDARLRKAREAGKESGRFKAELRLRRKDGSVFPAEVSSTVFYTSAGAERTSMIIRDITERKQAEALLHEKNHQLRALSARFAEMEEIERRRLASELHDQVGQSLVALNINLHTIQKQVGSNIDDSVQSRLIDSIALLKVVISCVRGVMSDLRPSVLDDLGLIAAVRSYSQQFAQRTGIEVSIEDEHPRLRLPDAINTALYRIALEAFSNIAKHANAQHIVVSFEVTRSRFIFSIRDDGCGFRFEKIKASKGHRTLGLVTMRERADLIGGDLRIESRPRKGTRIIVEVKR